MKITKSVRVCLRFVLIFLGIFHFAFPVWIDVILSIALFFYFKKIINSLVFCIICLIFAFSTNYLWGDYKIDDVFYRPHEKYSNNTHYKKNINETMAMPFGDLYAIGNESKKLENFEKIAQPRTVQFITDEYGYRNNEDIYKAEVLLVGDSFIVGNGTTQSAIPSSQLQNITNLSIANIAYPGDPKLYEKKLINFLKNKKKKQKIYVFYFEGNDFTIMDNIEKNNTFFNFKKYIDVDFDNLKSIYLTIVYPSDYSFFRIVRRQIFVQINNIKSFFIKKDNKNKDDSKIEIKKIKKKYVSFYKSYTELTKSKNINTYIFKDKNVLKNINGIFFIPTKYRVYTAKIDNTKNLPYEILKKGYQKEKIPVYDLTTILISGQDKINDFVYWRDDSHWNKIGIKLAMEYVSTKITNNSN
tara:strand:+ start:1727 stop:2965 length:1239 start_codon:yes stop_codon:yes gene_type:complete